MDIIKKPKNIFKYFADKDYRFLKNAQYGFYNHLSDEEYLTRKFKAIMGRDPDIKNPKTFNEKLQWLKLHDRKPVYTTMVDKYEAKKFVADAVGEEYIIPTLGVWDDVDEIDFDALPEQFVLKCTHNSGGLVVCRNKNKLDFKKAKKRLSKSLNHNFFYSNREWPYKNVKPRIIAEKYMEDKNTTELVDYKFYCFGGEPEFLYVSKGLENHATASISFITMDWNFAEYERGDFKSFAELPEKPTNFEKMKELCRLLSKDTMFLRVDLYEINGEVYFSELTFTPSAGFMEFKNPEHDIKIGDMLILKKEK